MTDDKLILLYELIEKKHNQIKKLSKPLKEYLNINYFSYQRIHLDGRYRLIANRPDFLECFLETRFYQSDPFLVDPHFYREGKNVYFMRDNTSLFDNRAKEIIRNFEKDFIFSETMLILIKNHHYYEIFVFTTPIRGENGINLLLVNYHMIEKFIDYFLSNSGEMLREVDEVGTNMAQIRGDSFLSNPTPLLLETKIDARDRSKFLNSF
jgi:hypothetical protein